MVGSRKESKSVVIDGETYTREVKTMVDSPWITAETFRTIVKVYRKVVRMIGL